MSKPKHEPMPMITRSDGEAYHAGLQCSVRSASYDFRARCGRLDMEDGDCCDMTGCIAFFEDIDPDVRKIETFFGAYRDTAYVLRSKGWEAVSEDGVRMGEFVRAEDLRQYRAGRAVT